MEQVILAIACVLGPDPANLGADRWDLREEWQERYSNTISALLLPRRHADPEIDHRLRQIQARVLGELCPRQAEIRLMRTDPRAWLWTRVIDSDSVAYTLEEVFEIVHSDSGLADLYFADWPSHNGTEAWLRHQIVPGEYDQWLMHVHYHRNRWATYPALAIAQGTR